MQATLVNSSNIIYGMTIDEFDRMNPVIIPMLKCDESKQKKSEKE